MSRCASVPREVQEKQFIQTLQNQVLRDPALMFGAKAFKPPVVPKIEPKMAIPFTRKSYI